MSGQLEAGTVWVNDWHVVNAAYPFGGFVHLDLSGRLDRRAYPLLLSTPPA